MMLHWFCSSRLWWNVCESENRNAIKRERSEYKTEREPSQTLELLCCSECLFPIKCFCYCSSWKWRDTSFRVFPLGLNPIPQRTSQIDMQPCLLVTHTGGSDTDASFLTASIKFPSSKITHQNKSETKWKTRRYSWTRHRYVIPWLHAWWKPQVKWLHWTWRHLSGPPGHKVMGECVRDSVLSQAENSCSIGLDSRLSNHDHSRSSLLYLLTDHLCNPINISSITSLRNPGHIFFIFNLGSWNSAGVFSH